MHVAVVLQAPLNVYSSLQLAIEDLETHAVCVLANHPRISDVQATSESNNHSTNQSINQSNQSTCSFPPPSRALSCPEAARSLLLAADGTERHGSVAKENARLSGWPVEFHDRTPEPHPLKKKELGRFLFGDPGFVPLCLWYSSFASPGCQGAARAKTRCADLKPTSVRTCQAADTESSCLAPEKPGVCCQDSLPDPSRPG